MYSPEIQTLHSVRSLAVMLLTGIILGKINIIATLPVHTIYYSILSLHLYYVELFFCFFLILW